MSSEELIDLHLAGELDEAATEELFRRLKEDPALQRQLLVAAHEDWALRSAVKGRIALKGAEREVRTAAGTPPSGRRARPRLTTRSRRGPIAWPWIAAAAGILLAVTARVMLVPPRTTAPTARTPRPLPEESPPPPAHPPGVEPPAALPPDREVPVPASPPPKPERPPEQPPGPRPPPKASDSPAPAPDLPGKDAPPRPPARPVSPETAVAIGTLETVKGQGFILAGGKPRPAQARESLSAGQGLETRGSGSGAALKLLDGTRIELGEDTTLREIALKAGKRVIVARGALTAHVTPQPRGEPMVFETPHAEATVLGTTLRLEVEPGEKGSTRLTVTEGRVRLRGPDGRTVDVASGHFAVAAAGLDLASRPLPKTMLLEDFENPRAVLARWETMRGGFPTTFSDRLEIDLSPRQADAYPGGWGASGGLRSRAAFPLPLRVTVDLELTGGHEDLLSNIVFTPVLRDEKALFRVDRRSLRGGVVDLRDATSGLFSTADVPCRWPGRERWSVEVDGDRVRVSIDGREVLDHRHGLKVHGAYFVALQANAKLSVPQGSAAKFDNVRVEHLPR